MAQPTEIRFIEATEAQLGVILPPAFRDHLLETNGGDITVLELPWRVTPVKDDSDAHRLKETEVDIVHETSQARQWPEFPRNGVVVADDGCGNYLVFLPREDEPKVLAQCLYVWWHEGGELEVAGESFDVAISEG